MTKKELKNFINESVKEVLFEHRLNKIVESSIKKYLKEDEDETDKPFSSNDKTSSNKRGDMKRNSVMAALKDEIIDHAPLAYKLYPSTTDSEKATARSLFSKKATGNPDADGQIRHFTDEEINKLYSIIRQR